jgi:methylaspartate mutase epsilon subunit
MKVSNKRLSDAEFSNERKEVLAEWPTGKDVILDEAVAYHRGFPPVKNFAMKVAEAKRNGIKLLHGAEGADTLERHRELLQYVQDKGQADLLSTWVDALTRNHRFQELEKALKEAETTGKVLLNGFPVVHYGVDGCRKVIESVKLPVCVYANGPDVRLIAEIAIAGGFTATSFGGSLCAFWGYTSNLPVEMVMRNYQYHYRLEGIYQERGIPILAQLTGPVSGMVPPPLGIAPTIIEALMAAEQGVKHLRLNSRPYGNMAQDIAYTVNARKLTEEYLNRFGYHDVLVYVGSHHPSNIKFPTDDAQAFAILGWSPMLAVLGNCEIVGFFTIDEGRQIPRKENNAASHRYVRMILNMLKDQEIDMLDDKDVKIELALVERETRAIVERVLDLGNGDIIAGSVRAVEAGVLDQPFATTQRTLSKVLCVRDARGAVRYLDHGNLPFTKDIVDFHKDKIEERSRKEGRKIGYDALIGDIFAPSQGSLISKPGWEAQEAINPQRRIG